VCAAALANIGLLERDALLARGQENESALLEALKPLAAEPAVAEVRGGVGLMAAVELSADLLERDPGAPAAVARGARDADVLVRPLGRGVAVSPPLTANDEHFAMIAKAIEYGLVALPV
jgi:adenosylmethionine-8-amino-7-oxononanoate aminotransferase